MYPQGIRVDTWSAFWRVLRANSRLGKPSVRLYGMLSTGDKFRFNTLNFSVVKKANRKHFVTCDSWCLSTVIGVTAWFRVNNDYLVKESFISSTTMDWAYRGSRLIAPWILYIYIYIYIRVTKQLSWDTDSFPLVCNHYVLHMTVLLQLTRPLYSLKTQTWFVYPVKLHCIYFLLYKYR